MFLIDAIVTILYVYHFTYLLIVVMEYFNLHKHHGNGKTLVCARINGKAGLADVISVITKLINDTHDGTFRASC